jgi:hypothetical protein
MLPHPIPDRASPDDVKSYSRTLTGKVSEVSDGGKAIVVRLSDGTRSKYFISDRTRLRRTPIRFGRPGSNVCRR